MQRQLSRQILLFVSIAALSACTTSDTSTGLLPTEALLAKGGPPPAGQNKWKFPLADAGLSLRSDGQYSDGTNSVYADGVCGVTAAILGWDSGSADATASGDGLLETTYPKGNGCGRTMTIVYPDNIQETKVVVFNLNRLQRGDLSNVIPVGASDYRRLILLFGTKTRNTTTSRCGRMIFGDNGNVGAGTDMLWVTRLSPTTWWVRSDPVSTKRAFCENLNVIYENINVDFVVESAVALPG